MPYTIYMAECPEGRRYIGCTAKTAAQRWRAHEKGVREWPGASRAGICDAIKRYGRSAFRLTVLATVETLADAAAVETLMIERYDTLTPKGYNFMGTSNYSPRPGLRVAEAA